MVNAVKSKKPRNGMLVQRVNARLVHINFHVVLHFASSRVERIEQLFFHWNKGCVGVYFLLCFSV
jgi:hypothetical protein